MLCDVTSNVLDNSPSWLHSFQVRDSGLDRDVESFYLVPVLAVDSTGRMGRSEVNVTLADVNDKAPEFDEIDFDISVPEDEAIDAGQLR